MKRLAIIGLGVLVGVAIADFALIRSRKLLLIWEAAPTAYDGSTACYYWGGGIGVMTARNMRPKDVSCPRFMDPPVI